MCQGSIYKITKNLGLQIAQKEKKCIRKGSKVEKKNSMTDKYIVKPVLKHCYCEHEYKNSDSKTVHQKGSKRCAQGGD